MKGFFIGLATLLLLGIVGVLLAPTSIVLKPYFNAIDYAGKKIDESTKYENRKQVEDTCRAMVSSYEADKMTYEQYKDSDNDEKKSWAEQAKMRANKTAASYNNYILENSFLWSGNVPRDIKEKLEYVE